MTEYLMSQGYSEEEIQTILEECEYHYARDEHYSQLYETLFEDVSF